MEKKTDNFGFVPGIGGSAPGREHRVVPRMTPEDLAQREHDRLGVPYGTGPAEGSGNRETSKLLTKLLDKHSSPMIIRKYTRWGFPIYIGVIADDDLSDLDQVVTQSMKHFQDNGAWIENIQKVRNLTGALTEILVDHYPRLEGCAVTYYVDKCYIQSLFGDFMNHGSCKEEYTAALGLMAHI